MTDSPGVAAAAPPAWRAWLSHPFVIGALLLVPIVFLLPPVPIDETRYLAVAWEMRRTGEFLVPHLNGAWYSDKPPLLFWLVNLGWLLTGVHAWTARAMTLLCSAASLVLLERLTRRLTASQAAARLSTWLLLGAIYFALFANAIMFDVLLATCVLLALDGVLDLEQGRVRRGVLIVGVAIGLGILAKGPVMLLDFGFAAVLAPWWSGRLTGRRGKYFGALGLALLLGAAIALAWAIPAALHGGEAYAHAIFLHQTVDRMAESFAHARPVWWYVIIFPLMFLPWPLALRGRWPALKMLGGERALRFALAWVLPTFIAFSLVSGKQPHYLLPLLPGAALAGALALARGALDVRAGLFGVVIVATGLVAIWLPHYAATRPAWQVLTDVWPLWGALAIALGAFVLALRKRWTGPTLPVVACLAVVLLTKLALIQGTGGRYDATAAALQVKAAQDRGQPIAHLGWHHGVYEFAGRLSEPLPALTLAQWPQWAAEHPDGLVMSFYRRYEFRAKPVYEQPFRGGYLAIWRVRDALASGIGPQASDAKSADESEAPDD